MSEEAHPRRRLSTGQTAFLVIGGLVLYVLAPGPVGLLAHFTGAEWIESAIPVLFYPLTYLHEHVPLVRMFYSAYFEWISGISGIT